jgi:malonyl-CoA O-methyltransferase
MTDPFENKKKYDLWSNFYDEYPNPTVAIDDLTFPKLYRHLRSLNVLDIGCGTGRHTQRLVRQDNRVTGVDISEGMLQQARKRISSPLADLRVLDFMADDIPNAPFDAIVMSLVLEHFADLRGFFVKANNLLKPNSQFFFSEIHPTRSQKGSIAHFKSEGGEEVRLSSRAHGSEEIEGALDEAGFSLISCQDVFGTDELASKNAKWERYLGKPMIQIWQTESRLQSQL